MRRANISETNLRLFLVLDALLIESSVTRAAKRLHLTQPAVSHALKQLRELYKDELFVRNADGLAPTPLALSLAPMLRSGLNQLERTLQSDAEFEPATSRRRFSLATVDYPLVTGIAPLMKRLTSEAPNVDVRILPVAPDLHARLVSGNLDTVLAGGEVEQQMALDKTLMKTRFISEDFVCILRAGHPALRRKFDLKAYCSLGHVLVSTGGADTGFVDSALAKLDMSRRVTLTVPAFVGAPTIVADTDLISTVPRAIGEFGRDRFGIVMRPTPLPMPRADAFIWWHQRFQNDPGHRWWRRMLVEAFAPFNTPVEDKA
jgi:DNA-binding transcriptional LysR family regulator